MDMREVIINKMVINIGSGSDAAQQQSARRLLESLTGRKPANEISKKRNPSFKITKGQSIGAFVTIRGAQAKPIIKRLLDAANNSFKESAISGNSLSFGLREYIDISGMKYDPKIGMLGMNVNISFKRRGIRVIERKRNSSQIPDHHRRVSKEEILSYMQREFGAKMAENKE